MIKNDFDEVFLHQTVECGLRHQELIKKDWWCGYVHPPSGSEDVVWRTDYETVDGPEYVADVEVWGGITYGPDEDGWVGFDDAHYRDLVETKPAPITTDREAVRHETEQLAEQLVTVTG